MASFSGHGEPHDGGRAFCLKHAGAILDGHGEFSWPRRVRSHSWSCLYADGDTSGGAQPLWRQDGKELYYLSLDGKMMAVDIKADARIESGIPHLLFNTGLEVDLNDSQYAVTADGQRFLLLKPISETTPIPITVVPNWTALLKK